MFGMSIDSLVKFLDTINILIFIERIFIPALLVQGLELLNDRRPVAF